MPGRFVSPALRGTDITSFLTVPLSGVEADIYNGIWNAVINRKLRSGVKLDEAVLGEIYGVSRTIIRKVLIIMEQEGIVSLPPNRGAYIASPSREEGEEVLEAISVLYQHFVRKLAGNPKDLTDEDRQRLEEHFEAEARANAEGDSHTAQRMRGELGTLLGLLTGNTILAGMMARYMIRGVMALALHQQRAVQNTASLGRTIWDFILKGEPESAAETVRSYTNSLHQSIQAGQRSEAEDLRAILQASRSTSN